MKIFRNEEIKFPTYKRVVRIQMCTHFMVMIFRMKFPSVRIRKCAPVAVKCVAECIRAELIAAAPGDHYKGCGRSTTIYTLNRTVVHFHRFRTVHECTHTIFINATTALHHPYTYNCTSRGVDAK